jgi:hypothetical protein
MVTRRQPRSHASATSELLVLAAFDRRSVERRTSALADLRFDFAPPDELVQRRTRLGPQQRRSDELIFEPLEAAREQRGGDDHTRVDDEH